MDLNKFDLPGFLNGNSGVSYNSLRRLANLPHAVAIRYCFRNRKQTGAGPAQGERLMAFVTRRFMLSSTAMTLVLAGVPARAPNTSQVSHTQWGTYDNT